MYPTTEKELPTKWAKLKVDKDNIAEKHAIVQAAFNVEALVWPEFKGCAYTAKNRDKAMYWCPYCFYTNKLLLAMKRHMAAYHLALKTEISGPDATTSMWRTFVQVNQE